MKILIVHNKYAQYGGEDKIVEEQFRILNNFGNNNVHLYLRSSNEINEYSFGNKVRMLKSAYASPKTCNDITELIKTFNPDIAHVHNIYPLISPGIYDILQQHGIPIVQTLHNYRFICPNGLMYCKGELCEKCLVKNDYYQCFYNKCYRDSFFQSFWYSDIINRANNRGSFNKITKFVALNEFMKQKMVQKGFDINKIIVIPNCIQPAENTERYNKKDYYIYIGRLSSEKGIMTLIKSFELLDGRTLKVIGDGPLMGEITEYIKQRKINNIELLGFKSGEEKKRLTAEARALIVPSECHENFPTVVLEAFALGTIAITSDLGGLPFMINEGINGFTFKAKNINNLVEKVKYIEENTNVLPKMNKMAQEISKEQYSPQKYYYEHMRLYESLVNNKNKR